MTSERENKIKQLIEENGLKPFPYHFCLQEAQAVTRTLGGKLRPIKGPLLYPHTSGQTWGERHFVAELEDGYIVALSDPNKQVYENFEEYMALSGIVILPVTDNST